MMGKTLDKLIAAGLADEGEGEQPTPEVTETVLELETDTEGEAVVAAPEGEGSAGDQGDNSDRHDSGKRVEVPKATLSQLRRTRREARDSAREAQETVSQRDAELVRIRKEFDDFKKVALRKPEYGEFSSPDAYEAALLNYHRVMGEPQAAQAAPAPQQPAAPQPQAQNTALNDDINQHYDRAEKLGVDMAKFDQAERAFRTVVGEANADALIANLGEGSEVAVMLAGSRPDEMARVKTLLETDPTGLRLAAHLGRIAGSAKITKRTVSNAPAPTASPNGKGGNAASSALQKAYDKADKQGDVKAMLAARKEARAQGVTLS